MGFVKRPKVGRWAGRAGGEEGCGRLGGGEAKGGWHKREGGRATGGNFTTGIRKAPPRGCRTPAQFPRSPAASPSGLLSPPSWITGARCTKPWRGYEFCACTNDTNKYTPTSPLTHTPSPRPPPHPSPVVGVRPEGMDLGTNVLHRETQLDPVLSACGELLPCSTHAVLARCGE